MDINQISKQFIAAAMTVHSALGPGLFERVYKECLVFELSKRGIPHTTEYPLSLTYDGIVRVVRNYSGPLPNTPLPPLTPPPPR